VRGAHLSESRRVVSRPISKERLSVEPSPKAVCRISLIVSTCNGGLPREFRHAYRQTNVKRDHEVAALALFFLSLRSKQCEWASMARDGCLIGYGPSRLGLVRRVTDYITRMLRGTPPGELPIEQPTKFEVGVNLRTAKALGLTMPPTLLTLADEVIE
jgi:ABC transporter substrate binding protein